MSERLRTLGAPARLVAFAVVLAFVGAAAALAGMARGDGHAGSRSTHHDPMSGGRDAMAMGSEAAHNETAATGNRANGLASTAAGYTFTPAQATFPLGRERVFRFRILDASGRPVRRFDLDGGVRLHLIVVRRDLVGYQHLHPSLHAGGSWSVPLALATPGTYRVFADFDVDGEKTVLGHDLFVPGGFEPAALAAPAATTKADGYAIALTHDELRAGRATELHFAVTRGGRPVERFEPYVGRRGHLVALQQSDVSYSHVHPEPGGKAGEIVFHAELAAPGRYRLFLQFKRGGVVHTAPFTVEVKP